MSGRYVGPDLRAMAHHRFNPLDQNETFVSIDQETKTTRPGVPVPGASTARPAAPSPTSSPEDPR